MSKLPQDVEEFIAARYCMFSTTAEKFISETDLRAWMTGHVRAPVEPTEKMLEAGAVSNGGRMFSQHVRALYQAMLNASKGE